MRTTLAIIEAALSRGLDLNLQAPAARSLLYRRMSLRQRGIFARAAQINPEYYGAEAIGTLTAGAIDIDLMPTDGVLEAEAITKVLIEDKGTSGYDNGDQVSVIPDSEKAAAYYAPRVTIKNRVIAQVATDLTLVTSIRVHYSYRPVALLDAEDGTSTVSLEDPFDELLVLDIYRWLLKKTLGLDAAIKDAAIKVVGEEEAELLATFDDHIRNYVPGMIARNAQQQGRVRG